LLQIETGTWAQSRRTTSNKYTTIIYTRHQRADPMQ
jgi:hypothetical protein